MRRYIDRAYEREKVDIAARLIVPSERLTIIPCRIVDRSDGGMKIQMQVASLLPSTVYLLGDESHDLFECQTRWQDEAVAGLMLIDICMYSRRREIMGKFANAVVLEAAPEPRAAGAGA